MNDISQRRSNLLMILKDGFDLIQWVGQIE
jgi:hypothetical protein